MEKKTFEPRTRNNKKSPTRFISCRVSIHRDFDFERAHFRRGRDIFHADRKEKSVKYPAADEKKKERNLIKLIEKQSDKNQRV